MELSTDQLLLRTVTGGDIHQVARMWDFDQGGVTLAEAQKAIDSMEENHAKNMPGSIYHLCLAVYERGRSSILLQASGEGICHPVRQKAAGLRLRGSGVDCHGAGEMSKGDQ